MIEGLKVLAVVPARGGSKGVPNKNVRLVAGKPLLVWTLEVAAAAAYLDRVVVSSDDPSILEIARQHGGDVPFVRPTTLAQDDTPGIEPVLHAIGELPGYDLVVLLQPTSPLRQVADIEGCLEKLITSGASSCVSVREALDHPYWTYRPDPSGRLHPYAVPAAGTAARRQELPSAYAVNGAMYAARVGWLLRSKAFIGTDTVALEMPSGRSLDIDGMDDFLVAERVLSERQRMPDR